MRRDRPIGFTLIELMVAIGLTLLVVGTYLRFFSNVSRYETNNSLKTTVLRKGDYIANTLENAIRLIGLSNTSVEFKGGGIISQATGVAVTVPPGENLHQDAAFRFVSPWGYPISRIKSPVTGTDRSCQFSVVNTSAASYQSISGGRLITRNAVYSGNFFFMGDYIIYSVNATNLLGYTPSGETFFPSGECANNFPPENTILTGPNSSFLLSYSPDSFAFDFKNETSGTYLFSLPTWEVPFFTLQFLVEIPSEGGGEPTRTWVTSPGGCGSPLPAPPASVPPCFQIKAVRFGFVIAAKHGVVQGTTQTPGQYCFFEDDGGNPVCYGAPLTAYTRYAAFSRVVYLRNYDYLRQYLLR